MPETQQHPNHNFYESLQNPAFSDIQPHQKENDELFVLEGVAESVPEEKVVDFSRALVVIVLCADQLAAVDIHMEAFQHRAFDLLRVIFEALHDIVAQLREREFFDRDIGLDIIL